jgi:hypothetical protein
MLKIIVPFVDINDHMSCLINIYLTLLFFVLLNRIINITYNLNVNSNTELVNHPKFINRIQKEIDAVNDADGAISKQA